MKIVVQDKKKIVRLKRTIFFSNKQICKSPNIQKNGIFANHIKNNNKNKK